MRKLFFSALVAFAFAALTSAETPRLVLFIAVDQLRGDMPIRYQERFGEGGFRYLMEHGYHYRNANYRHANTFTAVGHATLATGGNTPQHGIVGNEWYDRAKAASMNCVEDLAHPLLGVEGAVAAGRSPRNLTSSTFGDELVLASGGKSRVFGVSMKDRGAVILGGHLGKSYWYEPESGRFVTSSFYYERYPEWVDAWNGAKPADAWLGASWSLLNPVDSYIYGAQDDRSEERPYKAMGNTFPHPLPAEAGKDYYGGLRFTPMGDMLTLQFARELLRAEQVGQRDATDILTISLSATDYIGHAFGPNSLESEDNQLQLDRSLADFFAEVDRLVGLDRTLIVLSSDHGIDEIPEYTQHLGCDAGRHVPEEFIAAANGALKARFGIADDLVLTFQNPSLYLDEARAQALGLALPEVERALADAMVALPGFDLAVTRSDLLEGRVPNTKVMDMVTRAFHPKRSGNVLVVQSPSWYLYPEAQKYAAMHGSPYSYDTYVPIFFAGPGIPPGATQRPVAPEDVASTITAYLGIKPPSGNMGNPLLEVVGAGETGVR
ncbi:MAG: alkaline phosphatase family protein [Candidatus Hydrogenedentes bacterium]|nr:alkaline phosphatase family protein [Candidatus Hydrogenedentota bacterium]